MLTRLDNLLCLLDELTERGVKYRMVDGEFRAKSSTVSESDAIGIDVCREGLTLALRYKLGLCIACGLDARKRPRYSPRWCDLCWESNAYARDCPKEQTDANRKTDREDRSTPAPL